MPTCGAPGPDGLRPSHLRQFLGSDANDAKEETLTEQTRFIGICLAGSVPIGIRPFMFGASLVALRKKENLPPIAVGLLLRKVLTRVCSITLQEKTKALLTPFQLGLETPTGAETAVHAARRYLASCTGETKIVKLDFANAINCIHRKHVADCVKRYIPELVTAVMPAYCTASNLLVDFGSHCIKSSCGRTTRRHTGASFICAWRQAALPQRHVPFCRLVSRF